MSRVIVLIPHYNNYEELVKSILSIDEKIKIDVLVVDDGSIHVPKEEELKNIYRKGELFLEILPKNRGIEHALNTGLKIIEKQAYEYVGRLDCGDLNHKNKYTKQLDYLDANPTTYLLGTWAKMVDDQGNF